MRLLTLPMEATRFYARVLMADLECPRCGTVLRISTTSRGGAEVRQSLVALRHRAREGDGHLKHEGAGTESHRALTNNRDLEARTPTYGWNPLTSRLCCPQCKLVMIIGLLAWPAAIGGGRYTLPRDQVPHERQLAQLRAHGAGWWMPNKMRVPRKRAHHTNITAQCTCQGKENTTGQDPKCPIHGEEV